MMFFIVIMAISFMCYLIYQHLIVPSLYWKNRNIFYVPMLSRLYKVFVASNSIVEGIRNSYYEFSDRRYYGSFQFLNPSLLVRDLELCRNIMVKDFDHFTDHLSLTSESEDIMNLNLFSLKGDKWREMRATLSPAFTSSKMRTMFKLITESSENFTNYFLSKKENIIEAEMKDIYSRFTTDVIANCAFGIQCDSLTNPNNEFFEMGKNLTGTKPINLIRGLLVAFFPKLFAFFKLSLFPKHITNFFRKIVKDTIAERTKNNIVRPDMIHLLMEARKGKLQHEHVDLGNAGFATVEESHVGKSKSNLKLTDDVITAQALVFFFAGFETASTLLSFLSYELALNPDIQKKLIWEIDEMLIRSNGELIYEEVLKLKYLDQVICESLRKYPPGFALNRVCVKNYVIPSKLPNENDIILEKGCAIAIPVYGIHMDPTYFPNPDRFDPDRFSDENKGKIVPGSYLPFGSGPRNCIGSRFALLESKALVVSLFSKFEVVPVKRTPVPLVFLKVLGFSVKGGIWLGLRRRE